MEEERHALDHIVKRIVGRRQNFIAVCSCGWISHPMPSERAAEIEHDEHVLALPK